MITEKKVDDIDYTDHYYDQDDGYVDFIKTWEEPGLSMELIQAGSILEISFSTTI